MQSQRITASQKQGVKDLLIFAHQNPSTVGIISSIPIVIISSICPNYKMDKPTLQLQSNQNIIGIPTKIENLQETLLLKEALKTLSQQKFIKIMNELLLILNDNTSQMFRSSQFAQIIKNIRDEYSNNKFYKFQSLIDQHTEIVNLNDFQQLSNKTPSIRLDGTIDQSELFYEISLFMKCQNKCQKNSEDHYIDKIGQKQKWQEDKHLLQYQEDQIQQDDKLQFFNQAYRQIYFEFCQNQSPP